MICAIAMPNQICLFKMSISIPTTALLDIKEMILLLERHKVSPLPATRKKNGSKLKSLYDAIHHGKVHSDKDAMQLLYGHTNAGTPYRKLKSDLREKLLESVLWIKNNQSKSSDYQRAYYDCHRQWVTVRFLTGQNANTAALSVATSLFNKAKKFDFTLLCVDIASYLRTQYSLREKNDRKFKEVSEAFEHHKELLDAELKAEERYTKLLSLKVNNQSAFLKDQSLAISYEEELRPLLKKHKSYRLQLYGNLVSLTRYIAANDHQKAIEVCDNAIRFYKSRPYEAAVPLQIFYYQQLISQVQLRQVDAGEETARMCQKYLQPGTFNWFKYREMYVQLLLHTHRPEKAAQAISETISQEQFEFLPDYTREVWLIYQLYVYFLSNDRNKNGHKLKLAKIINEVSHASKDKAGLNLAILIIRALIQLKERRYREVIDEVEALEQYCYRHLRGKNTRRSYLFLKMLLQIPLSGFDASTLSGKVKHLQQKLEASPLSIADQTLELEIVPYEYLWMEVLKTLDENNGKG